MRYYHIFGLGWALGSSAGGMLWDGLGGSAVFFAAGGAMVAAAAVYAIGHRRVHGTASLPA